MLYKSTMSIKSVLKRELDFTRDFEVVTFKKVAQNYDVDLNTSLKKIFKAAAHNIAMIMTFPKAIIRGGSFGALTGAFMSAATGNDIIEGAKMGGLLIGYIDVQQYLLRSLYNHIKAQI